MTRTQTVRRGAPGTREIYIHRETNREIGRHRGSDRDNERDRESEN